MLTFKLDDDYSIAVRTTEDMTKLFFAMHNESKGRYLVFDEEHMRKLADSFSQNIRTHIILLLVYKDTPVGFLAAQAAEHPLYPSSKFAFEISFYVEPDHRKKHSWALVEAYEEWAKACGCKMATLSHPGIPALEKHYLSKDYQPVEYIHYKELI